MTVSRGDVVLFNAPFFSRPGGKIRPMLVVQNDLNNSRMANTILAVITTNLSRSHESTQVLVEPDTVSGNSSGLASPSVVSCENLLTAQRSNVVKKIGHLSDDLMKLVDSALKASLALT